MIEHIYSDLCSGCNACVDVCPDDVFDRVPGGSPVIARQLDCQTCYLCEAYCPSDALYVSPLGAPDPGFDAEKIRNSPLRGAFRRAVGWENGQPGEPDEGVIIPTNTSYKGDQSDKIRIHLMKVRSLSFVDPVEKDRPAG